MYRFISTIILIAITFNAAIAQQRGAVYLDKDLKTISMDKATYYRTHQKDGELYNVQIFYVSGSKYMDVTCKSVDPLVKQGKYVTYDPSGKKIAEGNYSDNKYDGRCAEYYSSTGKPKRVAKYENGKVNGPATVFDSISGNVILKCNFKNDELDGKMTVFDRATGNKTEDVYYVSGILHGPYATYDSISGARKETGYYDNGKEEGEWVQYYEDTNRVEGVAYFRSGYMNGHCAGFYFSGNVFFEMLFQGNQPVGKCVFYYDKPGVLSTELNFEDGRAAGAIRHFDSATGKQMMEGNHVNGKRSGKWIHYYPENGKVAGYALYTEGKLHGEMETFYPSGNKKSWHTYKFGEKYDAHIFYFEDGSIKQMEKYTGSTGYAVVTRYDSATRKPLIKGEYQKGKKSGQWYIFYPGTDVVRYNERYKAGMNDGEIEMYYADGSKELSGRFNNGKKVGKWNYYYAKSGRDWIKLEYNDGMKAGDLYVYYENGDLKRHEVRKDDTILSYECFSEDGREIPYEPLFVDAKFDGGDVTTFIGNELKYPPMAYIERKEGKVSVQFVVNEDGSISDAEVTQSLSEECDEEALRIVAAMPNWKPYTIDGVPFKTVKSVPVVFWIR